MPTPLVEIRHLRVAFGTKTVLQDVSFDVLPYEVLSIVGLNGSGKTTLLQAIIGIHTPVSGTIIRRTDRIGYVPQRLEFERSFPITVIEFLRLYHEGNSRSEISRVLSEVGGESLGGRLLGSLSGGELQRVLIANALIGDPELVLFDEPTNHIDITGENRFYELLDRISRTRSLSIVLVSHDLHLVFARSSRILCLHGHICCSGTPETMRDHADIHRIFGDYLLPYVHHHDHSHDHTDHQ